MLLTSYALKLVSLKYLNMKGTYKNHIYI